MYSPKQFRGNANEFRDLLKARGRVSSVQHAIDVWESEGGGSAEALRGSEAARTALADIIGWRASNSAG